MMDLAAIFRPVRGLLWCIAGCFLLMAGGTLGHAQESLPVDEDVFLKQPISFSPVNERALDERWLVPPETPYPFPACRIQAVNGVQRIVVDGEPADFYWRSVGATTLAGAPVERLLRESGVRYFIIDTDIHGPIDAEASRSFEIFQQRMDHLLAAVPDARVMVRVWMINTPDEFAERYPEGLLTGADGKTDWGWPYAGSRTRPNALNEWRRYCGEHLYRLVHRIGASAYADRTLGFYVGAMNSGEWWYYKGGGDPGWDYSQSRQDAFRRFLRLKYGDSPDAWIAGKPESEWTLPTLAERGASPLPSPATRLADYLQVLNLPVTNAACYFGRIVKVASSGRSLFGVETGSDFNCFPNNGTVYISHLLDSPDVDFMGGPSGYGRRGPGAAPLHRNSSATLARHGMLWFNEGDYRTHRAYGSRSGRAGEPPVDLDGTRQVLRREFARSLVKQYPTYLMDFGWDWYLDPGIAAEVGQLNRLASRLAADGMRRTAEIAVVTDQESQLYTNYFANPNRLRRRLLEQIGADYVFYELRDFLELPDRSAYKLVIFLNLRALSTAERQGLETLKGEGRTLLWLHAPGTVDLSRRSPDVAADLSALVGMEMATGQAVQGQVQVLPDAYAALFGHQPESPFVIGELDYPIRRAELNRQVSVSDAAVGLALGNAIAPFACVDPAATALATDESGAVRVAIRDYPDWRAVYAAGCLMSAEALRDIAVLAGCHLYLDTDDIVYANDRLLAVHAVTAGEKRLNLPAGQALADLLTGDDLTGPGEALRVRMRQGETRLFYLGDAATWRRTLAADEEQAEAARASFRQQHPAAETGALQARMARSLPVADFYQLRSKYLETPASMAGPHALSQLCPRVWLTAGPFDGTESTWAALDRLGREPARSGGITLGDPDGEGAFAVSMRADRFLAPTSYAVSRPIGDDLGPWRSLAVPSPWVDDRALRLGPGQAMALTTYLAVEESQTVMIVFAAEGDADAYLNGARIERFDGGDGTLVTLRPGRNTLLVRIRRADGPSGFTCKILAPEQPGRVFQTVAPGVTTWLTPTSAD